MQQDGLENIALLSCSIEETEEVFFQLARHGQLKELAALLMAACRRLREPMQKLRHFDLPLLRENRKKKLFLLLDVFERAGDALEAYAKQEKYCVRALSLSVYL